MESTVRPPQEHKGLPNYKVGEHRSQDPSTQKRSNSHLQFSIVMARKTPPKNTNAMMKPGKRFYFTSLAGKRQIAKNVRSKTVPIESISIRTNESEWCKKRPGRRRTPWEPNVELMLKTTQGMCLACGQESKVPRWCCKCSLGDFRARCAQWRQKFELKEVLGKGIAVFAKQDIGRNEVIGDYTGELHYPDYVYSSHEVGYHIEVPLGPDIDSKVIGTIDGTYEGSFVRFLNHSCNANATFKIARVGRTRVIAVTIKENKGVKAGDEVTVNYGDAYFSGQSYCCCGYRLCRYPCPDPSS